MSPEELKEKQARLGVLSLEINTAQVDLKRKQEEYLKVGREVAQEMNKVKKN